MSDAASAGFAPRLVFAPGTVVEGKYRIERPLGQGEMGCVFLATHLRNGESIALKFMHPADPSQGPAAFAAFLHAARAAARFRSENVAHVRDMGMLEDGAPFLVTEYLEGGTLESLIRARGALPVAQSVDIAMQVARGLADGHAAGVIHRDVKPSNCFLARIPNGATNVKLLDFGGSRIIPRAGSAEDRRSPGMSAVGTFPYTAPEQIHAPNEVDERADIWSLGVVLYEMLSGAPPFRDDTLVHMRERMLTDPPASIRRTRTDVPFELEGVVMRCLEKRSDDRFREMADLTLALAPFRTAERRSSNPPPRPRSSPRPPPMSEPPAVELPPVLADSAALHAAVEALAAPAAPAHPALADADPTSRESVHMAIVSPIVARIDARADPTVRPSLKDRIAGHARALRAKPRIPLLAAAAALVVAGGLVSAAATSGSETPSAAHAGRPQAVVTPAASTAEPAGDPPHAAETAPEPVTPEPAAPPVVAPPPAPPSVRAPPARAVAAPPPVAEPPVAAAAPEPVASKPAARPSAPAKTPTASPAPVGTSGFGERE